MTTFAYLFRKDFDNPGDLYSCVMHYFFPNRAGIMLDVYHTNIPNIEVDVLFVGGGAIFTTNKFIHDINSILDKITAKYKIAWGVGYNPNLKQEIQHNFDLFGIRDFGVEDHPWVPCPSVLHIELLKNINVTPTKDFLVIDHWKRPIEFADECTRITNKFNNIQHVIKLIAEHRYILTSSYHAAYWATLLKKKTFVIGNGLPDKFYTMKHSPLIAPKFDYDLIDQATVHNYAFEECMAETNNFRVKVEELTSIEFSFQNSWNAFDS